MVDSISLNISQHSLHSHPFRAAGRTGSICTGLANSTSTRGYTGDPGHKGRESQSEGFLKMLKNTPISAQWAHRA